MIRVAIDEEVGWALSKDAEKAMINILPPSRTGIPVTGGHAQIQEKNIIEVMNLMLKAKNTKDKFKELIENEIGCLVEWCGGKTDT